MNKVIYSLRIMRILMDRGFIPVQTIPNPVKPQYNCWVFERTEEFDQALNEVLGAQKEARNER